LPVSNGFGGETVMCEEEKDSITFAGIEDDLTMDSGRRVSPIVTPWVGGPILGQEEQPDKKRLERRENALETL